MEACGSAYHWARQFKALDIKVQLISPHYVKPFFKTNKNDRNDAEAIVEAAYRPSMIFVPVKSVERQDIQAVHRVRELLVHQRTALINQAKGLLAERGIIIARSPAMLKRSIPDILSEPGGELSQPQQSLLRWGDAKAFKNGRHLAAWIGLVPRQHSSGGKSRLLGISKRGDSYLRTLLIHRARSVLIRVACKSDERSRWLQDLIARRGYNRATVALANKNARIIQAMLSQETNYCSAMTAA